MSNKRPVWTHAIGLAVLGVVAPSCTTATEPTKAAPTDALDTNALFLAIPREPRDDGSVAPAAAAALAAVTQRPSDFYLAINKNALGERWFLSASLKQLSPDPLNDTVSAASVLATRVVTFREQNERLYLVDASDTRRWSDVFDPEILVDAYPIIRPLRSFVARPGSDRFLLIDPSAGLADFEVVSDAFGKQREKFTVDLKFLQGFRALSDGVAYEEVFTGTSNAVSILRRPSSSGNARGDEEPNLFRSSGTLGISLRRYAEGEGYTPFPMPLFGLAEDRFFRAAPHLENGKGQYREYATKWNVHPGMKPIRWVIGNAIQAAQAKYPRYDLVQAVRRGVESWNEAFGFPVLEAVLQQPGEPLTDDDVNALLWDNDPRASFAFADIRSNPVTGETRGASVYMPSIWIDDAEFYFPPPVGEATPAARERTPDTARTASPRLHWTALAEQPTCAYGARAAKAFAPKRLDALSQKESVENALAHTVAHEIGHTLGLRHNFEGSLAGGTGSSVMDYLPTPLAAQAPGPLSYDRGAIRYLYGLASDEPQEAFCNDDSVPTEATCAQYDEEDHVEWALATYESAYRPGDFTNDVDVFFFGYEIDATLQYLRVGVPEERLRVWEGIVAYDGLPLRRDPAWTPEEAERARVAADFSFRYVLRRLYLDPASDRFTGKVDPPSDDAAYLASFLAQAQLNLLSDERSFETRRTVVDVLRDLQRTEALDALTAGREALVAQAAGATGARATQLRDLVKRIDAATNPYFD